LGLSVWWCCFVLNELFARIQRLWI